MTARLKLNRLSVHRNNRVMYDQRFHAGVNILHGDNGSGKSTVTDFIYFVLGGDLREWRKEASLASYALAEVRAGDAVLTLKREVSPQGARPMSIYFGRYEDAVKADLRAWEIFPYARPENGYSFSQVLFNAIGVPETISDGVSNITMHQLLRVLYSDQLTPIQRIFRVEPFDTWQTRQAVGDLLCGLGGYDLYALQLFLRDLEKEFGEVSTQLRSLITVASSYGDRVLVEQVESVVANATAQRDELRTQLNDLLSNASNADPSTTATEADDLARKQRSELAHAKAAVAALTEQIETLEFEIKDAEQFLDHLRSAVSDFEDASSTFFALGAVRFEFCPSCFAPLAEPHVHGEKACHLCGSEASSEQGETRALAVKLDLEMQINESIKLQQDRAKSLESLKSSLRSANARLRSVWAAAEVARRSAATKFETVLAEVSRQIGYLDSEIAQLQHRLNLAKEIQVLTAAKASLNERISEMKDRISATETAQKRRRSVAYTSITENWINLISRDLQDHSDFENLNSLDFDFSGDWLAVNGDKNRVGSASGMVVLKNSLLLALFRASLFDPVFNLPRFMLMDNIEDKGLVQERSWNFQRLIVETSEGAPVEHQIIFSTSKIAPELADSPMVVGGKYSKARRTLNIG